MWSRPHLWCADRTEVGDETRRCIRCGVCSHWPLAESCSGVNVDDEDRPETTRTRQSADYHASYARDRRKRDQGYAERLRQAQRRYAERKRAESRNLPQTARINRDK